MRAAIFLSLIFLLLAMAAAAFVCWPILRLRNAPARLVLAVAAVLVVLLLGSGSYFMLGAPSLALRTLTPPEHRTLAGLVAQLALRARTAAFDVQGWTLLGRGYFALGDPVDAASAFRRGAEVAPPDRRADLLCAYGEALMAAAQGAVTQDAETAFNAAAAIDPASFHVRYDLGAVYESHGDNARALAEWQALLAVAPAHAPWRGSLVDRIAALKSRSGASPDIALMVEGLARRLAAEPHDAEGWQRLVRSYVVLGEQSRALAALRQARIALKSDPSALAALTAEAASLKLAQ